MKDKTRLLKEVSLLINEIIGISSELQFTTPFATLQLNSLQFVKLTVACENEFQMEFDDDDLAIGEYPDLEAFIDRLLSRMQ